MTLCSTVSEFQLLTAQLLELPDHSVITKICQKHCQNYTLRYVLLQIARQILSIFDSDNVYRYFLLYYGNQEVTHTVIMCYSPQRKQVCIGYISHYTLL